MDPMDADGSDARRPREGRTMKADTRSRLLLALAALVMLPAFLYPLWSIRLVAPQYRDGLGMHIYVHDVRGHDRHDLQNINILNHYIGMQPIEPEEIPELDIMPVVLGALVGTGLLVALVGKPWLMAGWFVLFLGAGAAGMVDFYLWNIDYGHNLSPDAPIRIPDMTYSPPIIGTAQILNIRASSYPHLGALFLALSALLAGWGVFRSFRRRERGGNPGEAGDPTPEGTGTEAGPARTSQSPASVASLLLLVPMVLAGCSGEAPPPGAGFPGEGEMDRIVYGESQDPYCGETVETIRWGGELRTVDGDQLRFRSVECLAAFLLEERIPTTEVAEVKVVDFPHGWKLIDAQEAHFLHTPNLSSPTRLNVMAIEANKMAVNLQAAYTGQLMAWPQVLELVAREWAVGSDTVDRDQGGGSTSPPGPGE
jgi:copper chaperone NosL